MLLVRATGRHPSIEQVAHDPSGTGPLSSEHEKDLADALAPRTKDEGWTSFWLSDERCAPDRIAAAIAARKDRLERIALFEFPLALVDSLGLRTRRLPDPGAFECVADRHLEIHLPDDPSLLRLARALISRRLSGEPISRVISKTDAKALMRDQYAECVGEGGLRDAEKASPRVRAQVIADRVDAS